MGRKAKAKKAKQPKLWVLDECPACNGKELSTDYFSGEVYCLKCGLVIF